MWLAPELIKKLGPNEVLDSVMLEAPAFADEALGRHPKIWWSALANVRLISRFFEPSGELRIV